MGDSSWTFLTIISTGLGEKGEERQRLVLSPPSWTGTWKGFQKQYFWAPIPLLLNLNHQMCCPEKNKVYICVFFSNPVPLLGDSEANPPWNSDWIPDTLDWVPAPRQPQICSFPSSQPSKQLILPFVHHVVSWYALLYELPLFCTSSFLLNKFYLFFILFWWKTSLVLSCRQSGLPTGLCI